VTRSVVRGALLLFLAAAPALAAGPGEAEGIKAAEDWLKLMDDAQYGASWEASATLFQAAVSKSDWEWRAASVRAPLGKVLSRKLASKQLVHALPGAPDGTYVVLVYDTRFEHKEQARETVTVALESSGRFRGAGYFIR
jgi:hypothetical protein